MYPANQRKLSILAVDDDEADLALLRSYLSFDDSIELTCVQTEEQALAMLGERVFQLALVDYELGPGNGLQLLARLQAEQGRFGQLAVIMVTGQGCEDVVIEAMRRGVADYIPKRRLTAEGLVRAIHHTCDMLEMRQRIEEQQRQLERMARVDGLTGLFNRNTLMEQLVSEIRHASRHQRPMTLMILDLDHFKSVNDTYGHMTGDTVLVEFAKVLCGSIRETDFCGRVGGEEFCVVLPETRQADGALVAEKIRAKTAKLVHHGPSGEVFATTCSIGLTTLDRAYDPGDTQSVFQLRAKLYHQADQALYRAKAESRNCFRFYTQEPLEEPDPLLAPLQSMVSTPPPPVQGWAPSR